MGCTQPKQRKQPESTQSVVRPSDMYAIQENSPSCVAVLANGPTQAGVTTQCRLIANSENWTHLSSSELLCLHYAHQSNNSHSTHHLLDHSELTGSCLIATLLQEFIQDHNICRAIIDGFPMTPQDLLCWDKLVKAVQVACLVVFECRDSVAVERWQNRGLNTDEPFRNRLRIYREGLEGVVTGCRARGWSVVTVDAEQTVKKVNRKIRSLLPGNYEADG